MNTQSLSSFATTLKALLDETDFFPRSEWAYLLGTTQPEIEEWLNDRALPSPERLYMLLDVLRLTRDITPAPLKRFDEMAVRPAKEVSPLGAFMAPTVLEYTKASFDFYRRLRPLSREQKRRVLLSGTWGRHAVEEFLLSQ